MRFTDTLPRNPETSDVPQFAVYVVELRDDRGRRAGISNQAWTLLTPTPEVKGLHSELDSHGVYLIWEDEIESRPASLQFDYRMYRREKGSSRKVAVPYLRAVVHTRDGNRWSGVDANIEWEKTYLYWITPITRVYAASGQLIGEVLGEDSAPIEVTTHDVFPPAVPQGLLALPSQIPGKKFVDLLWTPDQEKDLAGYNVYRSQDGAPMARINPALIKMLSFQDTDVTPGHNYVYSVSAVDLGGNESARSPQSEVIHP